ncbi:MAG TPA: metallophosphoesterase, partial [Polyangia bacterium]|nr:metallophosphoesterase [Polyangia bacterium]
MAARRAHASWRPSLASRRYGIELRRFAGPATYRDQIAHLRIAHLTDQHVGRITPVEVQLTAVEMTNAEKPDLILLSGDFVCHSQLYLDQLTQVMRAFQAPVMAVLGNHDHWSGADEVRHALERGGVEVLCNRHTTITLRHERLQVVGLDDAYTAHARRDEAVKGLRHDIPIIGLSHIAEEADGLWRHGVPLVLSGHTHGGQVTLARLHEFAVGKLAGHKYVHGLYGSRRHAGQRADHEPAGAVYVGAGIGAAVVPFRIGDRGKREVTMFEL